MSVQQAPQSRVFVELVPWADRGRENYLLSGGETLPGLRRPLSSAQTQTATREVHVSGTAEVSATPDRAQVVVQMSSTKEAAAEAKKSVCRRLDYITQTLQQQGVQSENVTVTKDFQRVENAYHMEAELPDPRPPSLLITLLRSQITAKPRQDAVTQSKRDSDRLLPSLKPFGGSWWPAALKASPLAWFQGPSRSDPCALRNLTPPPRTLQKNSRLLLCDVPHPQCLPGLSG
ncbi:interleukin-1 receptor-associated kinase 1-binding protein 1 isoform X3 [Lagenorhynchus albirostris]|uniref:interleukin-1 receptor-associated kinase 1-binding protein 1 isoform X3 n=1 Tax=Lagenorhynchus albirostris TaxID=27610 RepID=UPI0028E968B5|nr:interleukin-1 receptor-associated kinase 1-binding protein 1 isoform X3 [Lagenorhynchus albirostris]